MIYIDSIYYYFNGTKNVLRDIGVPLLQVGGWVLGYPFPTAALEYLKLFEKNDEKLKTMKWWVEQMANFGPNASTTMGIVLYIFSLSK